MEMLQIFVESPQQPYKFESSARIEAMFNPAKLAISRQVKWGDQQAAKRDSPEMQFTGCDPATLAIDLLFDTYDSTKSETAKDSVKEMYVDKLLQLTTVEGSGGLHRPPLCRLFWGKLGVFFQGVLQQLDTQYTLFTSNGIPVRAANHCSFKQWRGNDSDLKKQDLMSADVAKVWVVKLGETLASIAAAEYGDPRRWPLIARENAIDDPLRVPAGTRLMLPAVRAGARRSEP